MDGLVWFQIASMQSQIRSQEAELRTQEDELSRTKSELSRLQAEEAQLEQRLLSTRIQLETIVKSLKGTQGEISQVSVDVRRKRRGGGAWFTSMSGWFVRGNPSQPVLCYRRQTVWIFIFTVMKKSFLSFYVLCKARTKLTMIQENQREITKTIEEYNSALSSISSGNLGNLPDLSDGFMENGSLRAPVRDALIPNSSFCTLDVFVNTFVMSRQTVELPEAL